MSATHSKIFFFQDSIPIPQKDSVIDKSTPADTSADVIPFTSEEVIGIIDTLEGDKNELDSQSLDPIQMPVDQAPSISETPAVSDQNSLQPDTFQSVFIEETQTTLQPVQIPRQRNDRRTPSSHEFRPDWMFVLILVSLILIAWLKLFYNKFFDHTLKALMNFQLSATLLRDQNIFSRRVAFFLNLNFVFIGGAFVYLLLGYFNIWPSPYSDLISYFIYSGVIMALLLLRYILSNLIGFIFQKQKEFTEYQHQILLIYKNLGIFLIPIVIGTVYIHENIRVYLVYLGGFMLVASLILRLIKGFKILMNKDVLIFYLILYLCILEILPLLIFYRFFSLSVLTS